MWYILALRTDFEAVGFWSSIGTGPTAVSRAGVLHTVLHIIRISAARPGPKFFLPRMAGNSWLGRDGPGRATLCSPHSVTHVLVL